MVTKGYVEVIGCPLRRSCFNRFRIQADAQENVAVAVLCAREGRDVERVAERIENAVDTFFDAEQNTQAAPPVERDDTSNVATPWATVTEGAAPLSTARAGEVRTALMRIGPETAPIHWTGRGRGTTLFRVGAKGAICLNHGSWPVLPV